MVSELGGTPTWPPAAVGIMMVPVSAALASAEIWPGAAPPPCTTSCLPWLAAAAGLHVGGWRSWGRESGRTQYPWPDCVVSCSQHGYRWQPPAHLCAGIESISLAVCDLLSAAAAAAADAFPAAAGTPRPAPAASRGLKPCSPLYSSLICTPGA